MNKQMKEGFNVVTNINYGDSSFFNWTKCIYNLKEKIIRLESLRIMMQISIKEIYELIFMTYKILGLQSCV